MQDAVLSESLHRVLPVFIITFHVMAYHLLEAKQLTHCPLENMVVV